MDTPIYLDYGEIRKISGICFVWDMPDFIKTVTKKTYPKYSSPNFEFYGQTWYLNYSKTGSPFGVNSRIQLWRYVSSDQKTNSFFEDDKTLTYRFHVQDEKSKEYWTSHEITDDFAAGILRGAPYHLFELLNKNLSRITPGGVLSIHLTFNLWKFNPSQVFNLWRFNPSQKEFTPSLGEDVDLAKPVGFMPSSCTTDTGSQTCSDSLNREDCPSVTESLNKLSQSFKELLLKEEDCDVTLNVKGRKFHAHQLILKCRSPVLSSMFQHEMTEKNSGIVNIDDCDPNAFSNFLSFLYTGKFGQFDDNNVVDLHYISHKYDVEELATTCLKYMISNLTIESFCEFFAVGLLYDEMGLIESAKVFFQKNLKQVVPTEKWKMFFLEHPTEAHNLLNEALKCL